VDFRRLNRRMHNKSMTADGLATIVGGRNIGDAYFDSDAHVAFVDSTCWRSARIAAEVGAEFDEYWNSQHARTHHLGPRARRRGIAARSSAARWRRRKRSRARRATWTWWRTTK
jgi:phosphatidylserine/phosphatidylglycerophosphate/cardiolipin synthase-like enzyme